MKRVLFVISVLLSLSMFCACSSDENETNVFSEGIIKDIIIYPVDAIDGYEVISSFFNSELQLTTDSYGFFVGFNDEVNICKIINSRKELQEIYSGDKDIPVINFQQYTLIIGVEEFPHLSYELEKKELIDKNGDLQLNLYVSEPKDRFYPAAVLHMYYWGLYPKVDANEVSVNVIKVEE